MGLRDQNNGKKIGINGSRIYHVTTLLWGGTYLYGLYEGSLPLPGNYPILKKWKDIDIFNIISYFSCLLFVFARVHLQGLEGGSMAFVLVFLVIQTENWSATSLV